METTPRGDEYVVSYAAALITSGHVPDPDVVSECGLSELRSSIHCDDKADHDALLFQTCVEEAESAEYATPQKSLFSRRERQPLEEGFDLGSRIRKYVDSKRRAIARRLCYARPTRSSWLLTQGSMGDISQLKEDLEHEITTSQWEVDLKLMKSVWGAHVRTPEEDELSDDCVCEPPRGCLCCNRPPEMVERDLLYAYQGLEDPAKDAEPIEDHHLFLYTQGQATYTLTRTWRTGSNPWTRGCTGSARPI